MIDENNEQVGIIEVEDARRRAQDAGLDLVEVSSGSTPPVCRIMDYGKWKYQQKKKEQKARSHSKHSELKEVRLRPKIDEHDLTIKTEKAKQFLREGDKVQFTMQFRGREMAHKDLGLKTLKQICDTLAELSKVETMPRMAAGRRMTMVLAPDLHSGSKKSAKQPGTTQATAASPAESPSVPVPPTPAPSKEPAPKTDPVAAATSPEPSSNATA